ncbi:MAG: hypothetical protein KF760_30560 [Candidatus Eremiobacteraeota bacterium]|nr:hypothetical protein [Candidatus Eremiobacteraeota bacterium]MCW5872444.1 hypothetical protein [Candidatus Eremiobacteraeota bacterium]
MSSKPGIFATLCRLCFGFITGLVGLQLYLESSWEGIFPVAMFFAFLLVVGGRWFLLGLLGFVMPLPPRKLTWGLAGLLMLALGCIGPTVSSAYQKSQEPVRWKAVAGSKDPVAWQIEYRNKVAEPFRRTEYLSRECEAICDKALKHSDFEVIRSQAQLAFVSNPKDYDDGARKAISEAWSRLQAEGLKRVKPTKLADPALSAAFKDVLEALAANPSRKVQLHYEAEGSLAALSQDKQFFSEIDPKYRKLPIVPVGDAFSAEAHKRRAGQVCSALQTSFNGVWPKGMMNIQVAPGDKELPGDVNFWVHATVHRIPGFYTNSDEGKITSLLYKCEVQWLFRITMDGKEIGKFGFRSEPAKHVSYRTMKNDPAWAAYSIVMDSAADNFARLIVGRLGLVPPPAPESYNFVR